jgi:hypothetical protein
MCKIEESPYWAFRIKFNREVWNLSASMGDHKYVYHLHSMLVLMIAARYLTFTGHSLWKTIEMLQQP